MRLLYIITPLLFAVSPTLFLYSANMYVTPVRVIWAPMLATIVFGIVILVIVNIYYRNIIKSSLLTSVFLLVFFLYGDIASLLAVYIDIPILLILFFLGIIALYFFNLKKSSDVKDLQKSCIMFFVVGCALLLMSAYNIISFCLANNMYVRENSSLLYSEMSLKSNATRPDIFYIILDGYGRQDILSDLYDYDNSSFISSLENRGFYVASKSLANYCQTNLSLASSLNMAYVEDLLNDLDRQSYDRRPLMELIRNNKVKDILESEGYYFTSFFTPYSPVDIDNVDNHQKRRLALNEFSHFLINKTPLPLLFRDLQYELYRRDILYVLENSFESLDQNKPNFVYAHIIPPHPPFAFDSDGEPVKVKRNFSMADGSHWGANKANYIEGYINHIEFINSNILRTVDVIISRSEKPIIIIQSDHGPGSELDWSQAENTNIDERLSILNAYYFYDHNYEGLYYEITPVNCFRVVFNQYFGAELELTEDVSFFSTWQHPYKFFNDR